MLCVRPPMNTFSFFWTMGLPSRQDHKARSNSATVYVRHRPETTLLYQITQEYWPEFQTELASHGQHLPAYVLKEFDEYFDDMGKAIETCVHRAYRWVYSTEEINSIMALTYCPCFGNGMADLVPSVRFGVKYRCIQLEFSSESSTLIKLRSHLAEDLICIAAQYFGLSGNIVFKLLILHQTAIFSFFATLA